MLSLCYLCVCVVTEAAGGGGGGEGAGYRIKNKNPTQRCGEQFCETSFKNGKVSAELTALYQVPMRFAIFPLHLSKVLHL